MSSSPGYYPPVVGQRTGYQAPPKVGDTTQSFTERPAPPKQGSKIGLAVGMAAFAGFLGGLLWSKVKKDQGEDEESKKPEEENQG